MDAIIGSPQMATDQHRFFFGTVTTITETFVTPFMIHT